MLMMKKKRRSKTICKTPQKRREFSKSEVMKKPKMMTNTWKTVRKKTRMKRKRKKAKVKRKKYLKNLWKMML